MALNDLDRKLKPYLNFDNGVFIEAGANDGLTQSNTYWFEKFRGWRGLLIEAMPDEAATCRRNRPRATVIQAALVASPSQARVRIKTAGLMAFVPGQFANSTEEDIHLRNALEVQQLSRPIQEIDVPARTLSSILDEQKIAHVDFFSLDVEGFELEVLKGLDLRRHRPTYLLVETRQIEAVIGVLQGVYERINRFSHHDYLLRTRQAP